MEFPTTTLSFSILWPRDIVTLHNSEMVKHFYCLLNFFEVPCFLFFSKIEFVTEISLFNVVLFNLESPRIRGGLKDMRVLKTTQSSFIDFIQDDYRTLPDANDRIFSTVVTASWDFSTATDVNFDSVWTTVKDSILEKFAGPALTGISSPSVQNTLYLAERSILDKVHQVIIFFNRFKKNCKYNQIINTFV